MKENFLKAFENSLVSKKYNEIMNNCSVTEHYRDQNRSIIIFDRVIRVMKNRKFSNRNRRCFVVFKPNFSH